MDSPAAAPTSGTFTTELKKHQQFFTKGKNSGSLFKNPDLSQPVASLGFSGTTRNPLRRAGFFQALNIRGAIRDGM
ncbi:MAG: hypothetical protein U0X76_11410 [Bacteroidia bacterium]